MTKTNSFSAKFLVGFVVSAMLFTLSYSPARAATEAEMQAQIAALMAQIAAMQGPAAATGSCKTFTMDLTVGASGADVSALQTWLMGKGQTIAAGATGYFGGQTQAALASFQSANGIAPAAGYFGPITRAKVNSMCTPAGDDDSSDDDSSDDDSSDDDSDSDDLSGEASLDSFEVKDGDDTDVDEGQEDASIADMEIEFVDGDARITRIDLAFVAVTTGEEDPWDTFEEISLWVDGEEVARMDATDEDEYLDEDDGSLRFTGLDIVAMEDEEITITVGATVQGSVDNVPATWRVDADAMRFIDGDDVSTTDALTGDLGGSGVSFDIEVEGGDDELTVESSDSDPDATTLALDDNETSDWITVFAFDLDTDDSTNDIEINGLPMALTFSSSTYDAVVNDARLVIDGEEFDDVTVGSSSVATLVFDIDSGEFVIEAGEVATVELQLEFKQLATGNEGITIIGNASSTGIEAEGADDLTGSQLSGATTGETHTLRTQGVVLESNSDSRTLKTNDDSTPTDDEGEFVIKFDVTAFESDIWVAKTAASGTAMGAVGVNYLIEDGSGNPVGTTTATASFTSTASSDGVFFKVDEGETETFTLTVEFDPGITGFYQLQLYSLNFNATSAAAPTTQQRALPAEDYETDSLSI